MRQPAEPFYIEDAKRVRAVAAPVRAAMIDTLEVLGPATILQVATALGYPPDGLYYHFTVLERNGLVVRVDPEGDTVAGGSRGVPGRPMTLSYRLGDRAQRRETAKVVAAMLRSAERSFGRAFAPGLATVDGPQRNLPSRSSNRVAHRCGTGALEPLHRTDPCALCAPASTHDPGTTSRIHVCARADRPERPTPGRFPAERSSFMTRAPLTCILLIALTATQPGSIVGLQPAPATTIPFDVANRHIVVQVKVNNSGPLSFVLDTVPTGQWSGSGRHGEGARAESPRRGENRQGRVAQAPPPANL